MLINFIQTNSPVCRDTGRVSSDQECATAAEASRGPCSNSERTSEHFGGRRGEAALGSNLISNWDFNLSATKSRFQPTQTKANGSRSFGHRPCSAVNRRRNQDIIYLKTSFRTFLNTFFFRPRQQLARRRKSLRASRIWLARRAQISDCPTRLASRRYA